MRIDKLGLDAILVFLAIVVFLSTVDELTRVLWVLTCLFASVLAWWINHTEPKKLDLTGHERLKENLKTALEVQTAHLTEIRRLNAKIALLGLEIFHLRNPDFEVDEMQPTIVPAVYDPELRQKARTRPRER